MPLALLLWFAAPASDLEELLSKFAQVYALVEREAADPVNPGLAIYEGAIPSLMRGLDPHSVFFNPEQFDQLREMQTATSKGFGTVVSLLPGRVIVLQTTPGSPAARAGIEPGDEILAVNGIRLDWLAPEQLIELLGETRRREARLDVRRLGSARLLQFSMNPEQLDSPSVDRAFFIQPGGVGYIRVTGFETATAKEVKEAVEKLGGAALKGLVLDLRNNPGGVMTAALETAALFLPPSSKLVTVRGRARQSEDSEAPLRGNPYTFPLAILINAKSASASEIVAGAMQDHKRAVIVGEQSYGKGLVQSVYPLAQGTGLALTSAYYYTPAGRSIQRPLTGGTLEAATQAQQGGGGLKPDIAVEPDSGNRLRAALEASGSFTSFATEVVRKTPAIAAGFEVSNSLLDDFKVYLSERQISPGVSEWFADSDWIRGRLQQEVLNQAVGVDKGDEIEMRRDPQVRRAVYALGIN